MVGYEAGDEDVFGGRVYHVSGRKSLTGKPEIETLERWLMLIADGFKLSAFRTSVYSPQFAIILPTWGQLTPDRTRVEPRKVKQAVRPVEKCAGQERIPSMGEFSASSKYNTTSANAGSGTRGVGAAASGVGGGLS